MLLECILTFVKAVIIIFKHATFFHLSNLSPESALTQAETDYQAANMGLRVQQFLTAPSQEHNIMQFLHFIMAIDIGLFICICLDNFS